MLERRARCREQFWGQGWKRFGSCIVILGGLFLLEPGPARAQSESNEDSEKTVERLVDQVQQLQNKVKELEAKQSANGAVEPVLGNPPTAAHAAAPPNRKRVRGFRGIPWTSPAGPSQKGRFFTFVSQAQLRGAPAA